ncbi:TRAP transporter small permease [Peribacillus acanthi]|uniref:TRAP transporter small permease n=1 Tax=Peribacillus acanthi TaxID=2171554 RepID=UPI000D3E2F61|nr:TRAP transporter small permease [Peribacillus acanthi]
MRNSKVIKNAEEIVASLFFLVMCGAVILGVIARLFNLSIVWTDELARYSFIWVVFIGSVAVLKRKKHITIEFLSSVSKPKWMRLVNTLISLCLIGIFIVLIRFGFQIVSNTWGVPTTSLGIPTGLVYLAVPIAGTLMLIYTIIHLIQNWRNKGEGNDTSSTERGVEI